ncbi:MAG: endonuclease III domain-containing protein [Thermoplasmata archaeon]
MSAVPTFPWPKVLDRLSALYGSGDWRVPYLRDHAEDPFQVLIGTILSQRTRDEATDIASARLFAKYPSAKLLAVARPTQIEPLIRGTGFYHTKARAIVACARELIDRYGGVVPRTLEELERLPSVGPKTANCVLVFGYGIPGIPVDTHVHRIANRLGIVRTRTPEETEAALRRGVDRRYWIPLNPLLVQHGQNLCRPIGPRCERCPIARWCATGAARAAGRPTPRPQDALRPGAGSAGRRRAARAARPPRRRGPTTPPAILPRPRRIRRSMRRGPRRRVGSS